ncbi:MAG: SelB C-terminal domain-containing protein [Pyrinomonadaceae bacterium]
MDVIVGTAGHIDHGKTALVRALTGTDADRLPEEKKRGITVDLGFAEMSVGDVHFGFVDVPGHERFVKNMLAGASGIDIVLLVIASDEGVMPQTREHFDICRLLDIKTGLVVLTKSDLVDAETLELAKLDASELVTGSFLDGAPIIAASSVTNDGVEELKLALVAQARALARVDSSQRSTTHVGSESLAANVPPLLNRRLAHRKHDFVARLAIDRSFSMKGFGAVVTGTLASGSIREGVDLELLPSGETVRVRGLQTHGTSVKTAMAGQRVAVNLAGVDHHDVTRGMVLAEPGILRPTQIIDAEIEVLPTAAKALRTRQRVRVALGTSETLARIQVLSPSAEIPAGETSLAQIRFETPVVAYPGERFIVRSYSPQRTIAGGVVIDALALKHRRREFESVSESLRNLLSAGGDHSSTVRLLVNAAGTVGLTFAELQSRTALRTEMLRSAIDENVKNGSLVVAGETFVRTDSFNELMRSIEGALGDFHQKEPLAKGISREALRDALPRSVSPDVFNAAITKLQSSHAIVIDKDTIRLASHRAELTDDEGALSAKILASYVAARLEPRRLDDTLDDAIAGTRFSRPDARKFFQLHLDSGAIVKIAEEMYFAKSEIDKLVSQIRAFAATTSDRLIDVAKFKELAGVSRKYAIPLLEYFDRERITRRAGDKRLIS